ncbi:MAG: DUF4965 domain-containing protein [Melioribacteraceae bacterium]|nr:DUF4965 domain-containing protein [Melioribacteraceae bacterium]
MKRNPFKFIKKHLSFSLVLFLFLTIACSQENYKQNLRAPATPLITIDPYTSLWSMTDTLYNDVVRHWTGTRQSIIGALRVDGKVYRFLGKEELPLNVLVAMSDKKSWDCNYTFNEPDSAWGNMKFDDSKWKKGKSAFGSKGTPNMSTLWETPHVWLRREFTIDKPLSDAPLYLVYSHDDDLDLYLNGKKIIATGNTCFKNVLLPLDGDLRDLINENGKNVIAAHCFNRVGEAFVDFGILQAQDVEEFFKTNAVQKSVELTATQSVYNFSCGKVDLKLTFTSPLLPDELDILSRPINYMSYELNSNDGDEHDVQIYFEATPELAVDNLSQEVVVSKYKKDGFEYLKTGTVDQNVLGKKGDNVRIDWGYFYFSGEERENLSYSIGLYDEMKKEFLKSGNLKGIEKNEIKTELNEIMPVLAYSHSLGKINSETVFGKLMVGYDDLYSIQYFGQNLKPWWKKVEGFSIENEFISASGEYKEIINKCNNFDKQFYADAVESGSANYADLCILAFRQSIAAHKLVKDTEGEILFLSKENFSNGSIGTVDVTYPSAPLYLYYNHELLKGMLNPIFYYTESGKWIKPFAPHDVGTYPIANGQTYGGDMPVEETGNMLILTAAIAKMEGNANYAGKHWETLTIWADYLLSNGMDPENQLCTDDFAGHFAHNTNLSVKAIMGIASYGKLAEMLGKSDIADKYLVKARKMAGKWTEMADDKDHYRLTFDKPGTWSQKYNLVWDKILGFNIFDKNVIEKEIAYYLTKQNKYGLPLDNRRTYTKSDWIIWTASLAEDNETFNKFIAPLHKFVNETPKRVPMTDWYETTDASQVGFQARSVVGGYFIKMLKDKTLSGKN